MTATKHGQIVLGLIRLLGLEMFVQKIVAHFVFNYLSRVTYVRTKLIIIVIISLWLFTAGCRPPQMCAILPGSQLVASIVCLRHFEREN